MLARLSKHVLPRGKLDAARGAVRKNVGWVKQSGPTEQFARDAILIALRVF